MRVGTYACAGACVIRRAVVHVHVHASVCTCISLSLCFSTCVKRENERMCVVCVDCECLFTRTCTHAVSANVQTKMASNFKKLFAPYDWSLKDD